MYNLGVKIERDKQTRTSPKEIRVATYRKGQEPRKESAMNTTMNENAFASIATYFFIDHIKQQIRGTEYNFKMAGNPSKPQYFALMAAKELHANYTFVSISTKKKVEKQTYAGLNLKLIARYVAVKGTDIQKAEYKHMADKHTAYPTVKSWFLGEFKGISVSKAEREIQKATLAKKKANIHKVVKVAAAKNSDNSTLVLAGKAVNE